MDIMQQLLTKDEIEMSIGAFQAKLKYKFPKLNDKIMKIIG